MPSERARHGGGHIRASRPFPGSDDGAEQDAAAPHHSNGYKFSCLPVLYIECMCKLQSEVLCPPSLVVVVVVVTIHIENI